MKTQKKFQKISIFHPTNKRSVFNTKKSTWPQCPQCLHVSTVAPLKSWSNLWKEVLHWTKMTPLSQLQMEFIYWFDTLCNMLYNAIKSMHLLPLLWLRDPLQICITYLVGVFSIQQKERNSREISYLLKEKLFLNKNEFSYILKILVL